MRIVGRVKLILQIVELRVIQGHLCFPCYSDNPLIAARLDVRQHVVELRYRLITK